VKLRLSSGEPLREPLHSRKQSSPAADLIASPSSANTFRFFFLLPFLRTKDFRASFIPGSHISRSGLLFHGSLFYHPEKPPPRFLKKFQFSPLDFPPLENLLSEICSSIFFSTSLPKPHVLEVQSMPWGHMAHDFFFPLYLSPVVVVDGLLLK